MNEISTELAGRVIAVPESRELDLLTALLERRGARVRRCPLVTIVDAPDPRPVVQWVESFARGEFTDVVWMTGEGVHRVLDCIDHHAPDVRPSFLEQLTRLRKITRGPKPARALRDLGLKPDLIAASPTTQGVIETLRTVELSGRVFGVQLYGDEPNRALCDYLQQAGAQVHTVAPYRYVDESADPAVHALLDELQLGRVDAITFTSRAQVERLFAVGGDEVCRQALARCLVAAVGPVVAGSLRERGVTVGAAPADAFFMKPLVSALIESLRSQKLRVE